MDIKPLQTDVKFLRKTIYGLSEQINLLTILQDISKGIVSGFDFKEIIQQFMNIVNELIHYKSAVLFIFDDPENDDFRSTAFSEEKSRIDMVSPENEILRWIFKEKRWVSIPSDSTCPQEHVESVLPLQGNYGRIGFLHIISAITDNIFNETNQTILSFLADQTATAIENQTLYSELERSKNYVSNIVESISSGIVVVDMADRITLINKNATAMLAIQYSNIIGTCYKDVLHEILTSPLEALKMKLLEDGFVLEEKLEHTPFRDFTIRLGATASLLIDDKGKRQGIIFVFRDMMAPMEIQRLTELDELKSEFVSNVSHELRTPLSVIKSYVEALKNQVEPDDHETQAAFFEIIDSETDRLTELVNDLLDISRIEAGKFDLSLTRFSFAEIVESVISGMGSYPIDQDIQLDLKIADPLPFIHADRDKLTQVLLNLLDNAIKFSPGGGDVKIAITTENERVWCRIADEGIGIDPQYFERIFDKFFRVDNSDQYEIMGTGLGLPIVKHIVESHGGEIFVESRANQGTTFSFYLPAAPDKNVSQHDIQSKER